MIKATRPDVGGVNFKRYESGGKSDTITQVIEKNEKIAVSKRDRVAAAKDKYQIKNHFDPAPKGKKKKDIEQKPIQDAHDEAMNYIESIGFKN